MEKNSNKVLLTVLGIAVLVVATIGATFAYFSATATTDAGSVETGILDVEISGTPIAAKNISPATFDTSDHANNQGKANIGHTTITIDPSATTITDGKYDIKMEATLSALNEELTGGEAKDVKWALYGDGEEYTGDFSSVGISATTVNVATGVAITPGTGAKTYDLYIWVENKNEAQNKLQAVTATAKLTVDAYSTKPATGA